MKGLLTFSLAALLLGWFVGAAPAQNTAADLAALLKDPQSAEVRRAAAFALKYNLQSASVVQDLIGAFADTDEVVRANASDAILQMTPKDAVPPLMLALKSNDPRLRTNAAITIGRIKRFTDAAVPNLVFMLKDENYEARQAAREALKRIQDVTREY